MFISSSLLRHEVNLILASNYNSKLKLRFLKRRTMDHDGIGGEAMRALSDDVDSLCLVKFEGIGKECLTGGARVRGHNRFCVWG